MESIYVFLIRNDVWIYILCGLGLLWYLTELIRSRGLLKRAMFGLEKERGRRMMSRSLALILLFGLIIAAVTYVNLRVGPTLPADLLKPPTPTPNIFATPLSSPTPAGGPATPTLVLAPTVTLPAPGQIDGNGAPIAPGEPSPTGSAGADEVTATAAPERPSEICSPNVNISAPPNGATISGSATFFGTATDDDFGYLDLEANGPQTNGAWDSLPVNNATAPIFDNIIGSVNVSTWVPGLYQFRLSVFDSAASLAGQCEIQLSVVSPG
jgi:hypothetical protein